MYSETIILGIIQGITEFLPVSSSGHLVMAQYLMGMTEENLLFDTILHIASIFAILFVFRNDILSLISNLFSRDKHTKSSALRYCGAIVLGTIPAAIIGVLFKHQIEALFVSPRLTVAMFFVTAVLLLSTLLRKIPGTSPITWGNALIIGCAQALAITPGISRSGSTIAIALLLGVVRAEAGRFSFMLALPAICGATILQLKDISSLTIPIGPLAAGFFVSMIVGCIALSLLIRFVKQGKLHYFAFYCIAAGIAGSFLLR